MNQVAQQYWNDYWKENDKPQTVSAWQFGASPDYLAQLVIDGVKTATCSGHIFYELENEPLPTTNDYSIILNSADEPVAIIKTIEVTLTPMNEVSEEFAIAEGEGDRTYEYWKNVHIEFFTKELKRIDRKFSEDMLLVCERFELIDVKE
ncbi:ASCH domain-containing protein [Bacillus cereus]|uniref:ASCH domain-containing protein n=1 Tax=Bacillus cereus TaxID=1396 RepID=A0AA44QAH4_BACCE|nr:MULTISPECIES: ASCH domain-containing protein [Bacillus cereus group]PFA13026.1 ASCH domain-containing protein [Bacillus cereus]PFN06569.1 ASCH domain-containing protein [Bacillus cereus]PFO77501.1 ASCH domain-containing protein [Bacillus cereus]PFR27244.1 ASCH domain-containing protein [Bacillus cereus]PFR99954.1 ASCH domain-containing protein [Bacillus cereus]